MLKKLLIALGLRHAPPPIRRYLIATSVVGVVPTALILAWRNRRRIASMLRRASPELEREMSAEAY